MSTVCLDYFIARRVGTEGEFTAGPSLQAPPIKARRSAGVGVPGMWDVLWYRLADSS